MMPESNATDLSHANDWIARLRGDVLFHDYPQCGRDAKGVGMLVDRVKDGRFVCAPPFAWWKAAGA